MAARVPTVQAGTFSALRTYLAKRRLSLDTLLAGVGMTDAMLADPATRVPLEATFQLFESCANALSDACFGLHYAEEFPVGGTGVLGQLLLTSATVRDGVKAIAHYGRIYVDGTFVFEEEAGVGTLGWEFPSFGNTPRHQYTSFAASVLVLRLRVIAGAQWRPQVVRFAERAPADDAEYERVLASRVQFEVRRNEIVLDSALLSRHIPQSIARLNDTVRLVGDRELEQIDRQDDVVADVRQALLDRFGGDLSFDLEAIAAVVGLQPRALQWRLGQRDTSYEKLLAETRRETAERLLRDSQMAMTEIAAYIRFSELSAFTRASQRWFDMSPSAYRHHLRK